MNQAIELYKEWLTQPLEAEELKDELHKISENEEEIYDRFCKNLEFGTGGLRGVIGAGTNRMNVYTVAAATQGLCDYINSVKNIDSDNASVVIAYDSRNKSALFAKKAAEIIAANNIKVYIFKELMPTPVLSYSVRKLGCNWGIVITASHNPAKYNGYKVYGFDGCQIGPQVAQDVFSCIGEVKMFNGTCSMPFEEGLEKGIISYIGDEFVEDYLDEVYKLSLNNDACKQASLKLVYTPLNGSGNKPVRSILEKIGLSNIHIVKDQELPDGNFPTCPYPNPEEHEALNLGISLCSKVGADLLIATDPDCDRAGAAVLHQGEYVILSGNETGVLLLDYMLSAKKQQGRLDSKCFAIKTIVTTKMAEDIAKFYGVEMINVLTGFKFIGEQIGLKEADGNGGGFVLGFEESCGYLAGLYARDKDAVLGSMLICEMAAYYKLQGKTLVDRLKELYKQFGYYTCELNSFSFEGSNGLSIMNGIMDSLRQNPPSCICGIKLVKISDYSTSVEKDMLSGNVSKIPLPSSNVISFELENDSSFVIRPSGTEPKLKVYYSAMATSMENAKSNICMLKDYLKDIFK